MTVQEEIRQRIERDPLLARLRRKIDSGNATFADTSAYNNRAAEILGDVFSRRLPSISPAEREAICVDLLQERYSDINSLLDRVQRSLDAVIGLQLAPQHAPFNSERAHQIGRSLSDPTVSEETQQRRARSAPATATRAMHDDRMKTEAKFRSNAGLKCYIIREGGSECCEWCREVSGKYLHAEAPAGIFRRHDNCKCTVIYDTGRTRQTLQGRFDADGNRTKTWEIISETERDTTGAGEPARLTREQAAAAGAGEPVRLTRVQAAAAGAGERVVLTAEQARELEEKHLPEVLTNGREHGKIKISGAVTGALDPDSDRADEHAKRYYASVRKMTTDVSRIAGNTGFTEAQIQEIKNFIFMDEHDLGDGRIERFEPSYMMAESWQRLIDGRDIQPHDLTLLQHETMERDLMRQGYSQVDAHIITSKKYNYQEEARRYYDSIKKHPPR